MMPSTIPQRHRRARGVALPVMLIMLLVMLVTSIYLLKSSNSTTLAASNLAYDATLSRAVDLGLHEGFRWLSTTANTSKVTLRENVEDQGYRAFANTNDRPRDADFWVGSLVIDGPDNTRIRYVIHRLCSSAGAWDAGGNKCVQTAGSKAAAGATVGYGQSLASDAPAFASSPLLHYVITARVDGVRGGNVINQMVVMIGA
jgi:Tfp pilus assembly protein PilX